MRLFGANDHLCRLAVSVLCRERVLTILGSGSSLVALLGGFGNGSCLVDPSSDLLVVGTGVGGLTSLFRSLTLLVGIGSISGCTSLCGGVIARSDVLNLLCVDNRVSSQPRSIGDRTDRASGTGNKSSLNTNETLASLIVQCLLYLHLHLGRGVHVPVLGKHASVKPTVNLFLDRLGSEKRKNQLVTALETKHLGDHVGVQAIF